MLRTARLTTFAGLASQAEPFTFVVLCNARQGDPAKVNPMARLPPPHHQCANAPFPALKCSNSAYPDHRRP